MKKKYRKLLILLHYCEEKHLRLEVYRYYLSSMVLEIIHFASMNEQTCHLAKGIQINLPIQKKKVYDE